MALQGQQLDDRYRLTFEHAHVGIAVADPEGRFVNVNRRFCEIVGREPEDLVGRSFAITSHPDDVTMARERFEALVRGEAKFHSYDRRYLRPNGVSVWAHVTLSAATDDAGVFIGVIAVVEDITEQRAAAEQIRFQSVLLNSVKQAVVATDLQGRVTYWSPYAEQMYEYTSAEAMGRHILDLIGGEETTELANAMIERVAHGETWTGEFEVRNRSGHVFAALVANSPILDTTGRQVGIVAVSQDLTDLKWRETEMHRRAQQQGALAHVGQIALGNASIGFVLTQAVAVVREVLNVAYCEVYKRGARFVIVASAGDDNPIDPHPDQGTHAQAAFTVESVQAVVSNYLLAETRFAASQRMLDRGVVSSATVPIDGGAEGPWGVLAAFSRAAHDFSQSEVNFLRALAMTLGQAIERRHTEVELQVRATQQSAMAELGRLTATDTSQPTLDRACELVMDGLTVEYSSFLESRDGVALQFRAGNHWLDQMPAVDMSHSQSGYTFRTAAPVVTRDYAHETRFDNAPFTAHGISSGLTVPVSTAHRKFGVLTAHTRLPKEFTAADTQFMQSLASLLGEAFERDMGALALAKSEQRFRGVIEGASDIIYTLTPAGEITSLNPRFESVTGWRCDEWIGKTFAGLMHPDDLEPMTAIFIQLMETRQPNRVEARMIAKNGETILVDANSSVKTMGDDVVEVIGFARDVTAERRLAEERRRLEVRLDQSHRLSSLGRLAATVAHEFNNVLMGIAPFAEILKRETATERGATAVDQIARAVKRGKRITEDILRFTQPAQPVLAVIDTEAWLASLIMEARSVVGARHFVESSIGPGHLRIRGDANQLHQSFTNLILNARDAMPDGGSITISACRERPGATFPFGAITAPERFVHFIVADTGIGIPPAALQHIFEPLFTTKRNGTGLGLSVTTNVVSRHGGEIFVESRVGSGTRFHVFIPVADVTSGPDISKEQPPLANTQRRLERVLLVEDDLVVADGLSALLQSEGVAVRLVQNGRDVMAAVAEFRPDAVILDIGLPDIEGTVVYASISERYPALPVVFSSGHADEKKVASNLGPHVAFLLKPYDYETLFATLRRVTNVSAT